MRFPVQSCRLNPDFDASCSMPQRVVRPDQCLGQDVCPKLHQCLTWGNCTYPIHRLRKLFSSQLRFRFASGISRNRNASHLSCAALGRGEIHGL